MEYFLECSPILGEDEPHFHEFFFNQKTTKERQSCSDQHVSTKRTLTSTLVSGFVSWIFGFGWIPGSGWRVPHKHVLTSTFVWMPSQFGSEVHIQNRIHQSWSTLRMAFVAKWTVITDVWNTMMIGIGVNQLHWWKMKRERQVPLLK